ncbi:uncharacterized protein V6R79_022645 [Siganus canaliculatus]
MMFTDSPAQIDQIVECAAGSLRSTLDLIAPLKKKDLKPKKRAPWFNSQTRELKKTTQKLEQGRVTGAKAAQCFKDNNGIDKHHCRVKIKKKRTLSSSSEKKKKGRSKQRAFSKRNNDDEDVHTGLSTKKDKSKDFLELFRETAEPRRTHHSFGRRRGTTCGTTPTIHLSSPRKRIKLTHIPAIVHSSDEEDFIQPPLISRRPPRNAKLKNNKENISKQPPHTELVSRSFQPNSSTLSNVAVLEDDSIHQLNLTDFPFTPPEPSVGGAATSRRGDHHGLAARPQGGAVGELMRAQATVRQKHATYKAASDPQPSAPSAAARGPGVLPDDRGAPPADSKEQNDRQTTNLNFNPDPTDNIIFPYYHKARPNRKLIEWKIHIHQDICFIGDSNLHRIPPFSATNLQIDSYPGGCLLPFLTNLQNYSPTGSGQAAGAVEELKQAVTNNTQEWMLNNLNILQNHYNSLITNLNLPAFNPLAYQVASSLEAETNDNPANPHRTNANYFTDFPTLPKPQRPPRALCSLYLGPKAPLQRQLLDFIRPPAPSRRPPSNQRNSTEKGHLKQGRKKKNTKKQLVNDPGEGLSRQREETLPWPPSSSRPRSRDNHSVEEQRFLEVQKGGFQMLQREISDLWRSVQWLNYNHRAVCSIARSLERTCLSTGILHHHALLQSPLVLVRALLLLHVLPERILPTPVRVLPSVLRLQGPEQTLR